MRVFIKSMGLLLVTVLTTGVAFAAGSQQPAATAPTGVIEISVVAQPRPNYGGTDGNLLLQHIEQEMNIRFNWEVPPAASYYDRLNLMMASGDVPDLLWTDPNDLYHSWAGSGLLLDMTDRIPGLKHAHRVITEDHVNAISRVEDGRVYGIPRANPIFLGGVFWRKDWLDQLGLAVPETIEEFDAAWRAIASSDLGPEGRTYAFTMPSEISVMNAMGPLPSLFPALGIVGADRTGGTWYVDQSGRVRHIFTHPDFLNGIERLARYYRDGLIDPEYVLNRQNADWEQKFNQGRTGSVFYAPYLASWTRVKQRTEEIHPGAEVVFTPAPLGVVQGSYVAGSQLWGLWAISADTPHADRIIDFLDVMHTEEWWLKNSIGVEGLHYDTFDAETQTIVRTPAQEEQWGKDYNPRMWFARDHRDVGFYVRSVDYQRPAFVDAFAYNNDLSMYIRDVSAGFYPPGLRALDNAYPDWRTDVNEVLNKIIMGSESRAAFDRLLVQLRRQGLDVAMDEMHEFYLQSK